MTFSAFGLLGACSNIIGISSYDIDPKLDDAKGEGGSVDDGQGGRGGTSVVPQGGRPDVGNGGTPQAGDASVAGDTGRGGDRGVAGDTSVAGDTGVAGETNTGGAPSTCQDAKDCDDTIDCTVDSCAANGQCVHTPSNTVCDATRCEACQAGIGCVAGPTLQMQLLLDSNFDAQSGDWDESGSDAVNIVTSAAAQTGMRVAQFGPAANNAVDQQYSDLLQWVTIPTGTVALTLTGYYKLTPGTKDPIEDLLQVGMYAPGATSSTFLFHSFWGDDAAQATWKAFSYNAPNAKLSTLVGNEYSFDLVAFTWDSVFQVDSLKLNATVCQ